MDRRWIQPVRAIAGVAILALAALAGALSRPTPTLGPCEVQQITKPDGVGGDRFGSGLGVDGETLVISDQTAQDGAGAAYVFRHDGSTWTPEAVLTSPEPDPVSGFSVVAISGDVIVVGDPYVAAPAVLQGAVYVFRFNPDAGAWEFEDRLTASDGAGGDAFGYSATIHGDRVLVGAGRVDVGGAFDSGAAYVFRCDEGVWTEEAKLTVADPRDYDYLGIAVSLVDEIAVVGSSGRDVAAPDAGAAYVYRRIGDEWTLEAELIAFDADGGEWFGRAVSASDDGILVGAPLEDIQEGAAYVFRFDGSEWATEAKLQPSVFSFIPWFGFFVAMGESGSVAVVGAPFDPDAGPEAGAAHVFRAVESDWVEIVKLLPSDPQPGGQFGSVSVSGDRALIGAGGQSELPGAVYVYEGLLGIDHGWTCAGVYSGRRGSRPDSHDCIPRGSQPQRSPACRPLAPILLN